MISHPTSKCWILKRFLQECIDEGQIRARPAPNASAHKVSGVEHLAAYEKQWEAES